MKYNFTNIVCAVASMTALAAGESFALEGQAGFQNLPVEMIEEIFSYRNREERRGARFFGREADAIIVGMSNGEIGIRGSKFKEKVEKIEELLELDQFISLREMPEVITNDTISHIGVSQELWFEVMGNNPSAFKEKKYCPETYKVLDGIEMCSDFPVERVQAQNSRNKNSDEEFITRLNKAFKLAGKDIRFRRATVGEYNWADTAGNQNPKLANDPELWKYSSYYTISDKAPLDLSQPSPSGEHQSHGVKAKQPNHTPDGKHFYRSSVWEWTHDTQSYTQGSLRSLVGGSWAGFKEFAASDFRSAFQPYARGSDLGSARLVMMNPIRGSGGHE